MLSIWQLQLVVGNGVIVMELYGLDLANAVRKMSAIIRLCIAVRG